MSSPSNSRILSSIRGRDGPANNGCEIARGHGSNTCLHRHPEVAVVGESFNIASEPLHQPAGVVIIPSPLIDLSTHGLLLVGRSFTTYSLYIEVIH